MVGHATQASTHELCHKSKLGRGDDSRVVTNTIFEWDVYGRWFIHKNTCDVYYKSEVGM